MKKIIFILLAGLMFSSATMAQNNETYIYCKARFYFTLTGRCDLVVDYGQFNGKMIPTSVNEMVGLKSFNSEMAAINWLGINGWELLMYRPRLSDDTDYERYILRMNVTGLSEEEINKRLAIFSGEGGYPPQNADGTFTSVPKVEEQTILSPIE